MNCGPSFVSIYTNYGLNFINLKFLKYKIIHSKFHFSSHFCTNLGLSIYVIVFLNYKYYFDFIQNDTFSCSYLYKIFLIKIMALRLCPYSYCTEK